MKINNFRILLFGLFIASGILFSKQASAQEAPEPCASVTLNETSKYVGAPEANWTISVTAPTPDCTWSATSDSDWLIVRFTTPEVPAGSGSVRVRSEDNMGPKREGSFTIGGVTYAVTQEAGPFCRPKRNAFDLNGVRGSGESIEINPETNQATATFRLDLGCENKTVSLISWHKESTTEKYPQTLFSAASGVFSHNDGEEHALTVDLPSSCQFQVDLLIGTFDESPLTAENDAILGEWVGDWIIDNTPCPPPTLITVTKIVVNDDEGTATAEDFALQVGPTAVVNGVIQAIEPGTYQVTETGPGGYTATFSGDCDSSGSIVLAEGDNKACTITNNDNSPVPSGGGGGGGSAPPAAPPMVIPSVTIVVPPVIEDTAPTGGVAAGEATVQPSPVVLGESVDIEEDTTPVGGVAAGTGSSQQIGWINIIYTILVFWGLAKVYEIVKIKI